MSTSSTTAARLLSVGILLLCLYFPIPSALCEEPLAAHAQTVVGVAADGSPVIDTPIKGTPVNEKSESELDNLLTFAGPENKVCQNAHYELKNWRNDEIEVVRKYLQEIWSRYPKLLDQAASMPNSHKNSYRA
ncbi:MAG: hypothetical protein JST89_16140 [Cyanobacteria bacterium SZAS-4]|nr:hypothetical protein [Cyanobacteria bacterium SZAS-4]